MFRKIADLFRNKFGAKEKAVEALAPTPAPVVAVRKAAFSMHIFPRHKNGGPMNMGHHRTKNNHRTFRTPEQLAAKRRRQPKINRHP